MGSALAIHFAWIEYPFDNTSQEIGAVGVVAALEVVATRFAIDEDVGYWVDVDYAVLILVWNTLLNAVCWFSEK